MPLSLNEFVSEACHRLLERADALGGPTARLSLLVAVQGMALLAIVAARSDAIGAAVAVAFFGAANGMFTLERATLVAERFAAHEYGAVSGRIAKLSLLGRAAAPFAVGLVAGATSFALAFAALAALLLAAVAVTAWRRGSRWGSRAA